MSRFNYEGRSKNGEKVQGTMEAGSESLVATQLIHSGITPLLIKEVSELQPDPVGVYFKLGYPTLQEMTFFCRQMYALTRASVPLVRSVKVVAESVTNEHLKLALTRIVTMVSEGRSLGSAMREYPNVFPTLLIVLVNVGENTGHLDVVFQQAATNFERELGTRKSIKMATRYPLMVILAITIALGIINVLVIPAFSSFFAQFNAELPLPTRILVAISDFTVHYWVWIVLGIALIVGSLVYYVRTPVGHYQWDHWKVQIPLLGNILKRALLARFARSFALCIRTGVPLLDSINLISNATDNVYVADKISKMRTDIEHGETLTASARHSEMFTPLVLQMISIGEEAGEIDRLLEEVAVYYEQELDYQVKQLSDYIEPVLLSVLACLVLLLALGVYLPMWDISKAAFGK